MAKAEESKRRAPISSERFTPPDVKTPLGPLGDLIGDWVGHGFNLIARPDFHDKADLYLQLNHTHDHIRFTAIGANIPNRGFGQDDINLFGLTYLNQIRDATAGSALHIEPGIWVTLPPTTVLTFPPDVPPPKAQLVARMATIPHGNAIVAEGIAEPFFGPPVLPTATQTYNGSRFPSFNSTPFAVPPTAPAGILFNAAGSSERVTSQTVPGAPPPAPFPQYDLSVPVGPIAPGVNIGGFVYNPPHTLCTRTPFGPATGFPGLANTPANQALVNDPIVALQDEVNKLVAAGYEFSGTALNIATQTTINFLKNANSGAAGPQVAVNVPNFGGSQPAAGTLAPTIPNIQFLNGEVVAGNPTENAQTAMVYATFWIETVKHKNNGHTFSQLQYAQMVVLDFPILNVPPGVFVNLGWPHITVGTLRKAFG